MARGGRPRKRFTSKPPTRTRRRPTTQASSIPKPTILPPRPKAKPKIQFSTRPPTRKFLPVSIRPIKFVKVVAGARGRKKIKEVSIRPRPTRPTRVTVSSPSGRVNRFITVSSKSATLRKRTGGLKGRPRKRKPTGLRSKPRPTRQIKTKRRSGSDFNILRTSFSKFPTRTKIRPTRPKPKRRFVRPRPRRTRSRFGSDFDVLNF